MLNTTIKVFCNESRGSVEYLFGCNEQTAYDSLTRPFAKQIAERERRSRSAVLKRNFKKAPEFKLRRFIALLFFRLVDIESIYLCLSKII